MTTSGNGSRIAYVQSACEGPAHSFAHDELCQVRRHLTTRGFTVLPFHPERYTLNLAFSPEAPTYVAGDLLTMWRLLVALGVEHRILHTAPHCLAAFWRRRLWSGTLAHLRMQSAAYCQPVFVKPYHLRPINGRRLKGQVLASLEAVANTTWIPHEEPLLCAQVVRWVAEYRAYILRSEILAVCFYQSAIPAFEEQFPETKPDLAVLQAAIKQLDLSGCSVAGYSVDFGLLDNGETALVEVNDGLALTDYGISIEDYADLHMARWNELLLASPYAAQRQVVVRCAGPGEQIECLPQS